MATSTTQILQLRILRKLRDTTAAQIEAFHREYIDQVVVRPLLTQGQVLQRNPDPTGVAPLKFIILVCDKLTDFEKLVTYFHEIIHVQLLIGGIPAAAHDEDGVDKAAVGMARKFSNIKIDGLNLPTSTAGRG